MLTSSGIALLDQVGEASRARDVGPLADHDEVRVRSDREALEAAEIGDVLFPLREHTRLGVGDGFCDRPDVIGRGPAAPADEVHEPAGSELADQRAGGGWLLVVGAEGVRQTRVGVAAHVARRDSCEFGEEGPHLAGPQRAVDPHREWLRVGDRSPEGFDGLAREGAAAPVADGHRDHQRELDALLFEDLERGDDRGLGVQGVEDGLDQQDVDASLDQSADLLGVGLPQHVERHVSERRVVDVLRDRQGLVRRADRTGDETRLVGSAGSPLGGDPLRDLRRQDVLLVGGGPHRVVGLGDGRAAEGVGFDDVRTGRQEGAVDLLDDVRPREDEQLVVALQVDGVVCEARAPKIRLREPLGLDHGAHGAVEDEDALGEQSLELGAGIRSRHALARGIWGGVGAAPRPV
jgi:hypothetical protein